MFNYLKSFLTEQLTECGSASLLTLDYMFYAMFFICIFFVAKLIEAVSRLVTDTENHDGLLTKNYTRLYALLLVVKLVSILAAISIVVMILILRLAVVI